MTSDLPPRIPLIARVHEGERPKNLELRVFIGRGDAVDLDHETKPGRLEN